MKKTGKTKGKERATEVKKTGLYISAGIIACIVVALLLYLLFNSAVAKAGDTVSVSFVGTLDNKSVFDSNVNGTPLTFTIGAHTVIAGFEDAVIGMKKGEVKTVRIPPEKAYGLYRSDQVFTINRSLFIANSPPETGLYYSFVTANGTAVRVKVVNVTESTVTIDANHILVGENLTFVIRLLTINPAK